MKGGHKVGQRPRHLELYLDGLGGEDQGVLVRESPFGAELEDAPFVLEVCGLHYGLLGEVSDDSGGGPHG